MIRQVVLAVKSLTLHYLVQPQGGAIFCSLAFSSNPAERVYVHCLAQGEVGWRETADLGTYEEKRVDCQVYIADKETL